MSELKFIETTDETIYTDILEELENGVGEPLYPGDERESSATPCEGDRHGLQHSKRRLPPENAPICKGHCSGTLWEKTET